MKAIVLAFAAAIVIAVGAGYLLNTTYQTTADARFSTTGAQLRGSEAGYNLVGKSWDGMNAPTATR
ncbi:hypothetical protein [Phreatobacter cathodiphilus]|uniref:Uncharacterized protein n=1 Tax=Phreatobacter cathodiphilus TaxID=1868589 RepID=A0A2S0N8N5_9HYPH|nr:hypothetical protein [Phreatobacter cathodiphilus]AVO44495.1 hypothetical protein C6569_05130 [Phreatobacter cathodiphilus]